ncbi:MAG: SDR family NAD(P)-dependent oxidoreductase [Anaerolineaceae bacterium]|nr:SDR family NAD(P)-dependent oxidoreductase [Anaerolineaceae bacterium]
MKTASSSNFSMEDKLVVITGPTSGIGKEIALQLASLGANLILACRDVEKGKHLVEEIEVNTGSKKCEVMHIDTSSQSSIHEFVNQFQKKHNSLDVLINNAGINQPQKQLSVDDIELTFATNVLGYYLLALGLLDLLKENRSARIINTASTFASDLDLTDLQFDRRPYDGRKAYAQSKACDRLLTWAFARRLEGSQVAINAFAPGLVLQTGLYRDVPSSTMFIMRLVSKFFGRSPSDAADTAVWLASSPEVEGISGQFFDQRKQIPCKFRNKEAEEELWRICERLTRIS